MNLFINKGNRALSFARIVPSVFVFLSDPTIAQADANKAPLVPLREAVATREFKFFKVMCRYSDQPQWCPMMKRRALVIMPGYRPRLSTRQRTAYNKRAVAIRREQSVRGRKILTHLRAGAFKAVRPIEVGASLKQLPRFQRLKKRCANRPSPNFWLPNQGPGRRAPKLPNTELTLEYDLFRDPGRHDVLRHARRAVFRLFRLKTTDRLGAWPQKMYAIQIEIKDPEKGVRRSGGPETDLGVISAFLMPSCTHLYTFSYRLYHPVIRIEERDIGGTVVELHKPFDRYRRSAESASLIKMDGIYYFAILGVQSATRYLVGLRKRKPDPWELTVYEAGYLKSRSPYLFRYTSRPHGPIDK